MDEIATRAHAGKGALYRRWPSKAALVVDAIADWRQRLDPLPDTGSLRGDLETLVGAILTLDDDTRLIMSVSAGLWSEVSRDPELAAIFSERVIEPAASCSARYSSEVRWRPTATSTSSPRSCSR